MNLAVALLMLAVQAKPECSAHHWKPYGLNTPCRNQGRTEPQARDFQLAWHLPSPAAALAADAWRLGRSIEGARAWLSVVKSAPESFAPLAALANLPVEGSDDILIQALDVTKAPFRAARRLLDDPWNNGDLLIGWWLEEKGREGMSVLLDAGLDQGELAVLIGLRGLDRLIKDPSSPPSLVADWARETIAAALSRDLAGLAAEIYLAVPFAARARIDGARATRSLIARMSGERTDIRRKLAVALLVVGERSAALSLARRKPNVPVSRDPVDALRELVLKDWLAERSSVDLFDLRVALRRAHHSMPLESVLIYERVPQDRDWIARRARWQADSLEEEPAAAEAREEGVTARLAPEWRRVRAAFKLEANRYRALAKERGVDEGSVRAGDLPASPLPFVETPAHTSTNFEVEPAGCPAVTRGLRVVTKRKALGGECLAVAESQALDPTGEVSGGGYWLLKTKGGAWERGVYLGLRVYRPYQIVSGGTVSLEKGILRIRAQRRQIDEESITFPPIGTRLREEGPEITLEARYSDLVRDLDQDGLTDLEEDRLMLDPQNPDTDSDGLKDGMDTLPNVARSLQPTVQAELLSAFFQEREKSERLDIPLMTVPGQKGIGEVQPWYPGTGEVTFVQADPSALRGLHSSAPIVFLDAGQARRARARFGSFYPNEIDVIVDDSGLRGFITWSESWAGGSLRAERKSGRWKLKEVDFWIT